MKGDTQVIDALNEVLASELGAINQYFIHAKMCENWGYKRLAANKMAESIGEMKHADQVIERILYLDGTPNMQQMESLRIGNDPVAQHRNDLALEVEAVKRLNTAIGLAADKADNGSRELLERILKDEEEGLDHIEGQLHLIEEVGKEAYLAEQINE